MPTSLSVAATRPKVKHSGESILFAVDFSKLLTAGETLASVAGITATPSGLTIGSPLVNAATFDNDEGAQVSIGHAAQFRLSGGTTATDYTLTVTVTTSSGNTRVVVCLLQIRDT